ncbi:hypothetical protein TMEN_6837 [Trichophyton mentagrophytes]|uniref:Uncharacterized protein n=2 Tax=Trichophyton interdigitale TaxID=101480 RepID=A0A9P4YF83_9EURO|nr:hypothetical protein H101_03208 [Trichophyton interdigitale H6]KAF3893181.1 hypothetical protein GY631_3814 [Trichophyton interdigitale]KDB20047.1 hypothetical protein H109_07988 [Trichophyton interdigitale MR816]GBF64153.1 hypothetical protein TMEN_6837 [Trichophyton mentagrophytes]KAF3894891.1 hypothetical protein GY632_3529 [Trichophyton interdigitale]
MAPVAEELVRRVPEFGEPSIGVAIHWADPKDILSVLFILGGDLVEHAFAQLVGTPVPPVAFSFGCVSYGLNAVVSAIGKNRLMPDTDHPCKIINGETGTSFDNTSWVLGRLLRDHDYWKHKDVHSHLKDNITRKWDQMKLESITTHGTCANVRQPKKAGLCVSIYKAKEEGLGRPKRDKFDYSGMFTTLLQLLLSAVPLMREGDWSPFLTTLSGSLLSIISGCLRQWRREKWPCCANSEKTVVLTKGAGCQHAIVIIGDGRGFDLEEMAVGSEERDLPCDIFTRVAVFILAVLWVLLVIFAAGLKTNAWYVITAGGMGTIQNAYVVGGKRTPESFGLPLEFLDVIGEIGVMDTLLAVEEKYPNLGSNMVSTFFPDGQMTEEYHLKWEALRARAALQGGKPRRSQTI